MDYKEMIERDLGVYGQDNPCPRSLTIVEGDSWRHYELGAIYGFVVYNNEGWFGLASCEEDDENWSVPEHPMCVSSFWSSAINETWSRMAAWIDEYIFEGWPEGIPPLPENYVRKLKKPLKSEEIFAKGEPDNAVLGTKYCYQEPKPFYNPKTDEWSICWMSDDHVSCGVWGKTEEEVKERYRKALKDG